MQSLCCVCRSQWRWKCGAVVVLFDKRVSPSARVHTLQCWSLSVSLSLASDMLAQFLLGDESKWRSAGKEDSTATTTTCDFKSCHLVVCSFRLPCSVSSSSSNSSIGKHYRAVPVLWLSVRKRHFGVCDCLQHYYHHHHLQSCRLLLCFLFVSSSPFSNIHKRQKNRVWVFSRAHGVHGSDQSHTNANMIRVICYCCCCCCFYFFRSELNFFPFDIAFVLPLSGWRDWLRQQ